MQSRGDELEHLTLTPGEARVLPGGGLAAQANERLRIRRGAEPGTRLGEAALGSACGKADAVSSFSDRQSRAEQLEQATLRLAEIGIGVLDHASYDGRWRSTNAQREAQRRLMTPATAARTAISFRVLGPLEAQLNDRPVALGPPKQRALLAALLLRAGEAISVEHLVDDLWPDDPPASARHAVQVYVSRLRQALDRPGEQSRIEARSRAYALHVQPNELDLSRFRALAKDARSRLENEPAVAADSLREALSLWRGRALSDLADEPGVRDIVLELDEERLEALELRIDADLAQGRDRELVAELERLTAEQPAREAFYAQLMLALYRAGRQAQALETYQRARRKLVHELGLEPGARLRGLQAAILRQDPSLTLESPELRARRHLPAQPNALIGRTHELAELTELVASGGVRLLTLTGPGGVGKTRLAIAVAERLAASFADGIWFVALAPLSHAALVPSAIARSLGLAEQAGRPLAEVLADYLGDRETLLVVDTVEHVVEGAAALSELLRLAPRLKVLTTSRVVLDVYGEHLYDVPPLDAPTTAEASVEELGGREAVALFVERARAARRDFTLTPSNAELVGRVCRALDGLPLALELAAARLRALELEELVAGLTRRLDLLVEGPRDAPDRQRTLRTTIKWSYDLLEPEIQAGLARLGVFAAPFPFEAAAAICQTDRVVLDALVERSLLNRQQGGRYAMLDTIREFARERLDASASSDVRARHAAHYAEFAHGRVEPDTERLSSLERELPELRLALEWFRSQGETDAYAQLALDLFPLAERQGYVAEGRRWLKPAVECAGHLDAARSSRILYSAALLAAYQSDMKRAAALGARARAASREACDQALEAYIVANASWFALECGDYAEAKRLAEQSAEIAECAGDADARYRSMVALLLVFMRTDRIGEGRRLSEQAVALARTLDDGSTVCLALANLVAFDLLEGRTDDAVRHSTEALAFTNVPMRYRSVAVTNLAVAELLTGRLSAAVEHLHEAAVHFEREGDLYLFGEVTQGVAAAAAARGRYHEAATLSGTSAMLLRYGRSTPYILEAVLWKAFLGPGRAALGAAQWDRLESAGRELPLAQAMKHALATLESLADRTPPAERLNELGARPNESERRGKRVQVR